MTRSTAPTTIDEYAAGFPRDVQDILAKIRQTVRKAAPGAEETIRYRMPAFNWHGRYLIYFAAYKRHIGLYPAPLGDAELQEEMAPYQSGKGTLRFPLDRPIPYGLIARVVKHRMEENRARADARRAAK